jgi:hypothetical protein
MKRYHGHMFVAPNRLYFICTAQGGAWAAAIGQGLGGAVGGLIAAAGSKTPGQAGAALDEQQLAAAAAENAGSLVMEPAQIEEIKETIWWRLIRWNGKKLGLPNGLGKPLKAELGPWARANNVKTKGKF